MERVAVLGASKKEDRYSYKAVDLLKKYGHKVYPINPVEKEILDLEVFPSLGDLPESPDTLSLYVNPKLIEKVVDDIIKLNPKRVIFNPGTESSSAMEKLKSSGITVIEGCTLIMLKTDQF